MPFRRSRAPSLPSSGEWKMAHICLLLNVLFNSGLRMAHMMTKFWKLPDLSDRPVRRLTDSHTYNLHLGLVVTWDFDSRDTAGFSVCSHFSFLDSNHSKLFRLARPIEGLVQPVDPL